MGTLTILYGILLPICTCNIITNQFLHGNKQTENSASLDATTQSPLKSHETSGSAFKQRSFLSSYNFYRLRHKGISQQQVQAEKELQDELERLERRPRWAPSKQHSQSYTTPYSLYTSNTNNGAESRNLQRQVQRLLEENKRMAASIESLVRYKSTSEQRINRLETRIRRSPQVTGETSNGVQRINSQAIATLQETLLELSETINNLESPKMDTHQTYLSLEEVNTITKPIANLSLDVSEHVTANNERLGQHDELHRKTVIDITSLQHQLMRLIIKTSDQELKLKELELKNATSDPNVQVNRLQDVVQQQDNAINTLQQTVAQNGACCGQVTTLSEEVVTLNERIDEAEAKIIESKSVIGAQQRRSEILTNKLNLQKLVLKRLLSNTKMYQRNIINIESRLHESMDRGLETLNETIFDNIYLSESLVDQRIETHVQREHDKNNEISFPTDLHSNDIDTEKFLTYKEEVNRNFTEIAHRIGANDKTLVGVMLRFDEIERDNGHRTRALWSRIRMAEKKIRNLEDKFKTRLPVRPLQNVDVAEDILFLNSSFRQLRTTVRRQFNNVALLHSRVERLNAAENRINERLVNFKHAANNDKLHFENVTFNLRHSLMTHVFDSGQVMSARLDVFGENLQELFAKTLKLNSDLDNIAATCSSFLVDRGQQLNELESKVNQIMLNKAQYGCENKITVSIQSLNSTQQVILHKLVKIKKRTTEDNATLHGLFVELQNRANLPTNESIPSQAELQIIQNRINNLNFSIDTLGDYTVSLSKRTLMTAETLQNRLDVVDTSFAEYALAIISSNELIVNLNNSIKNNKKEFIRFRENTNNAFADFRLKLKNLKSRKEINKAISNGLRTVNTKVTKIRQIVNNLHFRQDGYQQHLDGLNATFRRHTLKFNNTVSIVQGDINQLKVVDASLQRSINLNNRALTEHRNLHNNLTSLSDGLYDVIDEHSEALDVVRNVVSQLNESLEGEKDYINEAVSHQIRRHYNEVREFRIIMYNFTSLVQNVLMDMLNQEISIASNKIKLRSIIELMDNYDASKERINQDIARLQTRMTMVEVGGEETTRQVAKLFMYAAK